MAGLTKHMHHRPCRNCGHGMCHHQRVRVQRDKGPVGSYHYQYRDCPEGNGVYRR